MNVSKEEILEILSNLPDVFDSEELHFALFLLDKIKHSEYDIRNNEIYDFDTVAERAEEWLRQ